MHKVWNPITIIHFRSPANVPTAANVELYMPFHNIYQHALSIPVNMCAYAFWIYGFIFVT